MNRGKESKEWEACIPAGGVRARPIAAKLAIKQTQHLSCESGDIPELRAYRFHTSKTAPSPKTHKTRKTTKRFFGGFPYRHVIAQTYRPAHSNTHFQVKYEDIVVEPEWNKWIFYRFFSTSETVTAW